MEMILMGGLQRRRTLYACMWGQATPSVWWQLGLTPLWLASQGYRGLVRGDLASYTCGVRQRRRLPCRVISIGNLTVGGTGKTPLTMWVARWYQQQGWRVAVLSRGYGAHTTGRVQVVSVGDGPLVDWRTAGDEPYHLACALPGVAVLIGRDRYASGHYAYEHLGAQVVILDDGFQHHALQRDLDVVLIDTSNPFGHGTLLPRGILREPLRALRRADAIILTRVEMASDRLSALLQQIRRWNPVQPIYRMTTVAEALCRGDTGSAVDLTWLQRRRLVAFTGIGNPQAFGTTLARLGGEVAALLVFPDHHPYTARDWQVIVEMARQRQAAGLVTTEKDAVRLEPSWQAPIPVYTLRIGVAFVPGDPSPHHQLQALMHHAHAHS
jgi:tetraacyldisaccharide 4'-kinase